jgi:hypothetical protein
MADLLHDPEKKNTTKTSKNAAKYPEQTADDRQNV